MNGLFCRFDADDAGHPLGMGDQRRADRIQALRAAVGDVRRMLEAIEYSTEPSNRRILARAYAEVLASAKTIAAEVGAGPLPPDGERERARLLAELASIERRGTMALPHAAP